MSVERFGGFPKFAAAVRHEMALLYATAFLATVSIAIVIGDVVVHDMAGDAVAGRRGELLALGLCAVAATAGALRARVLRSIACDDLARACEADARQRTARLAVEDRRHRIHQLLAASEGLRMAFQPIIRLDSSTAVGFEALARFPDGRSPDLWFRDADELGLGVELETAAIRRAIAQHRGPGYLAVNAGPPTLVSEMFIEAIAEHDGDRHIQLVVELTEHALVEDYDHLVKTVRHLRRQGLKIAVDDVGSGFSSLQHVLAIRPDILKLDRVFTENLHLDARRRSLIELLVRFGEQHGVDLVAEGVETEEQLRICRELGVGFGQGYLLGRPLLRPDRAGIASRRR